MPAPLVSIHDLYFSYRVDPALHIADWAWQPGEHWAVVGGNGAGKTTLACLISDAIRPGRGTVSWQPGLDPNRDVAYVSFDTQRVLVERDIRFDDSETREEAIDTGTSVRDLILQGAPETPEFTHLLALFGLTAIADRGLRVLSTGESRKALLARALFSRPRLLLLDNPLEGLDQAMRREVTALIESLLAGPTPVMLLLPAGTSLPQGISHVLELDGGEVLYSGPVNGWQPATTAAIAAAEAPLPPPLTTTPPLPPGEPLIEMAGVNVQFHGQPVLTDIHWTLAPGQHCVISGPNGSGKSTLLSLISGDSPKAYGQPLRLFGKPRDGRSVWEIKAFCGLVNTSLQLLHNNRQRVLEVVASGLHDSIGLRHTCGGRERELTLSWIRAAGLEELATARFDRLSFGQQRMALLARALVKTPPLLILDEPCLGLDAAHRERFLALVDRVAAAGHTQVLYVSHEPTHLPRCINQWLRLVPHPAGGSTAEVNDSAD